MGWLKPNGKLSNGPRLFGMQRAAKVAVLFVDRVAEMSAVRGLSAAGAAVAVFGSMRALLSAQRQSMADALVIEGPPQQVSTWLAMLEVNCPGHAPVIVVGDGDAQHVADAMRLGAADHAARHDIAAVLTARVQAQIDQRRPSPELPGARRHSGGWQRSATQ